MAGILDKPIWSADGLTLSNVLLPVTNLYATYNVITEWYDGTPMDDSKLDADLVYVKFENKYLLRNMEYGQVLQKDTMPDMRALSTEEILLLRLGVYKHVQLNGYDFVESTPSPINYILSDTTATDDGGSVIVVGSIKLEHDFIDSLHIAHFGCKSGQEYDNAPNLSKLINYLRLKSKALNVNTNLPIVRFTGIFNTSETINIDFDGFKMQGSGIRNSVIQYTGDGIGLNITSDTFVRYLDISNFGLRTNNPLSKAALSIYKTTECLYSNIWINGNVTGFSDYGVSIKESWSFKFVNVRVTNCSGIGWLLREGEMNAGQFIGCSGAINSINRVIAAANGVKFVNFQTEGASSGIETKIAPYDTTRCSIVSLTLDNEYCETKGQTTGARYLHITDVNKDAVVGNVAINGLDIVNPYAWGAGFANYAVDFNVTNGIILGNITGGFFHGFQTAVVKTEKAIERLLINYVRPLSGFNTGVSVPIIESTSGLTGCMAVNLGSNGLTFSKPLANGTYKPYRYDRVDPIGAYTINNTDDFQYVDVNANTGNIEVFLPKANTTDRNIYKRINKVDSTTNTVTLKAQEGDTLEIPSNAILKKRWDYVLVVRVNSLVWRILEFGSSAFIVDASLSQKGLVNRAVLSGNTATPAADTYSKEQVQGILNELRDMKTKLIQSGAMSNI